MGIFWTSIYFKSFPGDLVYNSQSFCSCNLLAQQSSIKHNISLKVYLPPAHNGHQQTRQY